MIQNSSSMKKQTLQVYLQGLIFHTAIGRNAQNLRQELCKQRIVCAADGSEVCCSVDHSR